jgi:hypothetical protein
MTTHPVGLRLDAEIWSPSPLGIVGPHALLGDVAAGGQVSYRPLLSRHLSSGPMVNGLDRAVTVIESRAQLREMLRRPELAPFCPPLGSAGDDDDWQRHRKVAVVVHDRVGQGVNALVVAGFDRFDPRIAHVSRFWVPNQAILRTSWADDVLGAGWLTLFRQLAQRGAVGVTVAETFSGRDIVDVLRRMAGFRPLAGIYRDLGLAPCDHAVMLAEWRATVEDGRVVRFATRPDLGGPARVELMQRLAGYLDVAGQRPTPERDEAHHERLSLGGEVGIDGIQGWGNVLDDDWFQSPADEVPDPSGWGDADKRARAALLTWLRAEGGSATDTG